MSATIALIGLGQIGYRHLQALHRIGQNVKLEAVDPSINALSKARQNLNTTFENNRIQFFTKISDLSQHIDVAIIATNSQVRRDVITELVNTKKVRYLILEKVLFQKKEDYFFIQDLITQNGILSWVNCSRRLWPSYKELRGIYYNKKNITLTVHGGFWGLGCNAIHFIDLMYFLTGSRLVEKYNIDQLDRKTYPSKREGFLEFTGTLTGKFTNNNELIISSNSSNDPLIIELKSEGMDFLIREDQKCAKRIQKLTNYKIEEIYFEAPVQSELSNHVVNQLLDCGTCELTPYNDSLNMHLPFIDAINSLLTQLHSKEVTVCPIT